MADVKNDGFDAIAYADQIEARKKGKVKPAPTVLKKVGQEHTFVTLPYTVVKNDSGFEMMGKGNPDVKIIGDRPPRPDRITIGDKPQK